MTNQEFWAITTYFNPAGWSTRLNNYRIFKSALNIPLLTIEWSPTGDFQLCNDDADRLIQLRGGDLMWQKERLLALSLEALPSNVKYVAWLDCDVVFASDQWLEETREALQDMAIVQPFNKIIYLDHETTQLMANKKFPTISNAISDKDLPTRRSFMSTYEELGNKIVSVDLGTRFKRKNSFDSYSVMQRPAYGHAWAAKHEALKQTGFYDRCVLGGGDLFFCYGLVGRADALITNHLEIGWDYYTGGESYRHWAEKSSALCKGQLISTNSTLLHLFHGTLDNRQYKSRIDGLSPFHLDLDHDLVAKEGQPWSWARQRTKLNAYFMRYMQNRKEDG